MVDFGLDIFALRAGFGLHIKQESLSARTKSGEGEERTERSAHNGAVVRWVILPWLGCSIWLSYWVQMPSAHAINAILVANRFFSILILATAEAVIFLGGACRARSSLYPDAGWLGKAGAWVGFAAGGVVSTLVALALAWAMMKATELGAVELSGWAQAKASGKERRRPRWQLMRGEYV